MIVVAARLITLAAFAAHAVLGCCAHHGHASDGCCRHGGGTSTAAAAAPHVAHADGHGCHHGHDHDGHEHAMDATVPAEPGPSPAGEHHACDEGGCSFQTAPRVVVPDLVLATFGFVTVPAVSSPSVGELGRTVDGGPPPDPLSSAGRCVWQQTWQI